MGHQWIRSRGRRVPGRALLLICSVGCILTVLELGRIASARAMLENALHGLAGGPAPPGPVDADSLRVALCNAATGLQDCLHRLDVDIETYAVAACDRHAAHGLLALTPAPGEGDLIVLRATYHRPAAMPVVGPLIARLGDGHDLAAGTILH